MMSKPFEFLGQLKAATGSLSCLEGEGGVRGIHLATRNFTTRCHYILHTQPSINLCLTNCHIFEIGKQFSSFLTHNL